MVDLPSYWLEHIGEDYTDLPNLTNLDHTLILEHNDSDDQENDQTWNRIEYLVEESYLVLQKLSMMVINYGADRVINHLLGI